MSVMSVQMFPNEA